MNTLHTVRNALFGIILIGGLAIAGPGVSYGEFSDESPRTGTMTVAEDFNSGGPIADSGDSYTVYEGEIVEVDGSGSSSPNGINSYTWEITSGPGNLTGATGPTGMYEAPSDVPSDTIAIVMLTVDDGVETDTDNATVTVLDESSGDNPPIARFTYSRSGQSTNVDLDGASSYDPDDDIVSWEWDVGDDGSNLFYGESPGKRTVLKGEYVRLTVYDENNNSDTIREKIP